MDTVEQSTLTNKQQATVAAQDITDVEFKEVPTQATDEEAPKPLSLVQTVTLMLEDAGVEEPNEWEKGLPEETFTSPDLNVQRFLINRFWRVALIHASPEETINARGCLVDGRWELAHWVQQFKTVVIPCAVKTGLLAKKA